MNLLLDTHVLLWWLAGDKRLASQVNGIISDPANSVHVSVASLWEIAVKVARKKMHMGVASEQLIGAVEDCGFTFLPIHPRHAVHVANLPFFHADPFDRMLVAQAQLEPMHLITHDQALAQYDISVIAV